MPTCTYCHQPQTAALVICPECYRALTERTDSMDNKKLAEALRDGCPVTECAWCDFSGKSDCECKLGSKAAERIEELTAQLAEKDKQLAAAVEDIKLMADFVRTAHGDETVCFACKFDCYMSITDAGVYENECPGFENEDCFEWRGPQEAGEVEHE